MNAIRFRHATHTQWGVKLLTYDRPAQNKQTLLVSRAHCHQNVFLNPGTDAYRCNQDHGVEVRHRWNKNNASCETSLVRNVLWEGAVVHEIAQRAVVPNFVKAAARQRAGVAYINQMGTSKQSSQHDLCDYM